MSTLFHQWFKTFYFRMSSKRGRLWLRPLVPLPIILPQFRRHPETLMPSQLSRKLITSYFCAFHSHFWDIYNHRIILLFYRVPLFIFRKLSGVLLWGKGSLGITKTFLGPFYLKFWNCLSNRLRDLSRSWVFRCRRLLRY